MRDEADRRVEVDGLTGCRPARCTAGRGVREAARTRPRRRTDDGS